MKQILWITGRIYNSCLNGFASIGGFLILLMLGYILASIFLRHTPYAFGWALEASEYTIIIFTFFATGWLLKNGGHTNVDIITNLLTGRSRDRYNAIIYSIVAVTCLVFTIIGVHTAWDAYVAGTLQVKLYTFPKWILISFIPIGGFFLFIESVKIVYKNLRGKRILIVDDNPDIIEALQELLKDYVVHEALDFDTASDKLSQNIYDLVILDIVGVRGSELLKMAVKRGYPAIILTAYAFDQETFKESIKAGAISFLPKERMSHIGLFVNDVLTMSRQDAREQYFRRFILYLDDRFGPDWSKDGDFGVSSHKNYKD